MRSISASPEIRIIVSFPRITLRASSHRIGRLHRRIELRRIASLFAWPEVRSLTAAERRGIVEARLRQVDHRHARLGIALEMRGVLEACGADAGAQTEIGVV